MCWGKLISLNNDHNQRICHAQWEQVMYSALHEDRATTTCCLELHVSGPFPHSITNLDIDFRFLDMAQSESAKALNMGNGFGSLP